jgi:hypothetical protein
MITGQRRGGVINHTSIITAVTGCVLFFMQGVVGSDFGDKLRARRGWRGLKRFRGQAVAVAARAEAEPLQCAASCWPAFEPVCVTNRTNSFDQTKPTHYNALHTDLRLHSFWNLRFQPSAEPSVQFHHQQHQQFGWLHQR